MALVVRADFHWLLDRRVKVKSLSPASARLRDPETMDKATHPPPRCKEGTLVEVMQHRWCSPISDGILAR